MKWEEVQKKLISLISDPNSGLEEQNAFIQSLQQDYITRDSISEEIKKKDEQIKALQTTNANLAQKYVSMLDVSQAPTPEEEEQEEENLMQTPDDLDAFLAGLNNEKED